MPKVIDHRKRKELIVKTALKVYDEGGLKEANLSRIAQECGLSRTTVYQYFKDISDVFNFLVKTHTDRFFEKYTSEEWSKGTFYERLVNIINDVVNTEDTYSTEISRFMRSLNTLDIDMDDIIRHRTARLKLFLSRLIRSGIKEGSIVKCKSNKVVDSLITMIISYAFMIAFFPKRRENAKLVVKDYLNQLSSEKS